MAATTNREQISTERWVFAAWMTAIAAELAAVAGVAFGVPLGVGVLVALALGAIACKWTANRLPREWDGMCRTHRGLSLLWLIVALAAMLRIAGVAWFMADPNHPQASAYWFDRFFSAHSCYSQYWRGAELARAGVENLYDTAYYDSYIGRFQVDEYLYLPQFLILPRLALAMGGNFYQIRAVWFALEAGLFGLAIFVLCRWMGGRLGSRVALLSVALWVSTPVLATLQVGNYQLAAIALSMIAMVLFERNRSGLGGALLALAAFKMWPGLLVVYLTATRRWRAVAWTIAFSLFYCLVAYLWMGGRPFQAFVHYDWPRLVSRNAWPYVEDLDVSAINDSVPGLVLKLKMLGVKGMTNALEDTVEYGWTFVLLALAAFAAWRDSHLSRLERASCWLALLTLASFRAPFVPDIYGLITPLWLWSLVAAAKQLTWRNAAWLAVGWFILDAVVPFTGTPLVGAARMAVATVSQFTAIGLCCWTLLGHLCRSPKTGKTPAVHRSNSSYADNYGPELIREAE